MKYLLYTGLLFGFVGSAYYAIRAEAIRDRDLNTLERGLGSGSAVFRFSRWFMKNRFYVMSTRIGGLIVAAGFLTVLIYLVVFP